MTACRSRRVVIGLLFLLLGVPIAWLAIESFGNRSLCARIVAAPEGSSQRTRLLVDFFDPPNPCDMPPQWSPEPSLAARRASAKWPSLQTIAAIEDLVRECPSDLTLQHVLADFLERTAFLEETHGSSKTAVELLTRSLQVRETIALYAPEALDAKAELDRTLFRLGQLQSLLGHGEHASQNLERALLLCEDLASHSPVQAFAEAECTEQRLLSGICG